MITYRIPAARWEDAVGASAGSRRRSSPSRPQATEVGGQIVDLEARLRNLRASEQVLVGIAQGTGKVTDLLEVQTRISDVRGQIEQLDGQRAALEDQVAYGTLVTTYGLEVAQVEEVKAGLGPGDRRRRGVRDADRRGQAIASGAIWFAIVWLPRSCVARGGPARRRAGSTGGSRRARRSAGRADGRLGRRRRD